MNQREAKRRAVQTLAGIAGEHAAGPHRGLGQADGERMTRAYTELAQELTQRGSGDHGTLPDEPDPDQIPLIRNPCCDDTGYADYAAVPCPNPKCTAVLRLLVANGEQISEDAQRLLDNERRST